MGVHKTKKFFSLRRKIANSGQCGQKINYQTYSDLVYDTHHRPQCDIDNQNSHSCDYRHGVNCQWKNAVQSASMKWPCNRMVSLTVKKWETQDSVSINWDDAVVDDEAKCEIGYGQDENQSKFCRYKKDFTARWR